MAETQMRSMTPEEFYEWQLDQDERYELVDGVPVPLRATAGASNVPTISGAAIGESVAINVELTYQD